MYAVLLCTFACNLCAILEKCWREVTVTLKMNFEMLGISWLLYFEPYTHHLAEEKKEEQF